MRLNLVGHMRIKISERLRVTETLCKTSFTNFYPKILFCFGRSLFSLFRVWPAQGLQLKLEFRGVKHGIISLSCDFAYSLFMEGKLI